LTSSSARASGLSVTPFSDLELSRRLERAEGYACVDYVDSRRRIFPDSGADWIECAGAYAAFDGVDPPITQTFGLGLEELTPAALETIERFFIDRGAPVFHEVSPFAGIDALNLLCERGYRPIELSSVMYRATEETPPILKGPTSVRVVPPEETALWNDISTRGWAAEHPEYADFFRDHGAISAARKQSVCFLALYEGTPGAAGALSIHEGVALFAGSSTVPELRRRGLQAALLHERMRYAHEHGCDLAMMVAQPGSNSQRNAERQGFQIAYTRVKWKLSRD
jgi:GNAT superfamily N-acetyltransferase